MDKREMIKKALVQLSGLHYPLLFDALAKQAIVENCTVKHIEACPFSEDRTKVLIGEIPGHHGTPGEAIAIIVPLADE